MKKALPKLFFASLLFFWINASPAVWAEIIPNYSDVAGDFLYAPKPQYPHTAAIQGMLGAGKFQANVDTETGKVVSVLIVGTTGYQTLDDAVVETLGRWRLKPHTVKAFYLPVTFLRDATVEEAFAKALRYTTHAPFPQAPLEARAANYALTRGWYELLIDQKTGVVTDVKVAVSSHSSSLDRSARKTFL